MKEDENTHYCLIKNIQGVLGKSGNKGYFCRNCVRTYTTEQSFENHKELCLEKNQLKQ